MARRLRVDEIGFYHIINRGVERRTIFLDDDDYSQFILIVDESAKTYNFNVHSFCLMDNHYHLLIQINSRNLSLLMRQINSKYSIYFNKKYKRVEPLWQGRFKSWFIYDLKFPRNSSGDHAQQHGDHRIDRGVARFRAKPMKIIIQSGFGNNTPNI